MSDLAFFEYATVIPPIGNQREGTPAHYLVEVLVHRGPLLDKCPHPPDAMPLIP
jgi:hypothetical protein